MAVFVATYILSNSTVRALNALLKGLKPDANVVHKYYKYIDKFNIFMYCKISMIVICPSLTPQ